MSFDIWVSSGSLSALKGVLDSISSLPSPYAVKAVKSASPPMPTGGVVLMLGTTLLQQAIAHMVAAHEASGSKDPCQIKRNTSLNSSRGRVYSVNGAQVLFSFDPRATEIEPERIPELQWDLQLVARLASTGSIQPKFGNYQYVEDFDAVVSDLRATATAQKPRQVACDLETIGLDPYAPEARVVSIALTVEEGVSHVYYLPVSGLLPDKVRAQLEWILTSPTLKLVGANFKFDLVWIARHFGLWCTNQTFDTLLVGSLLNENRSNSLNMHTKIYVNDLGGYDDGFNAKYDKGRMDLVPKDDFLLYAGGDTDACFRVANVQRKLLVKDKKLTNFYVNLLQPAATVFAKLESRGVIVDLKQYKTLEFECQVALDSLAKQALALLPAKIKAKYADDLKLTRDVILREYLFTPRGLNLKPTVFTEKEKLPSCALDHLKTFMDHAEAKPFIELLAKHSSVKKTLSTYIVGFMKHLRSDGRFHPTYQMGRGSSIDDPEAGTVTGRLSAKDPAYQTIPKRTAWAKPLRTVYVPPPGHGILKADYSQGELRITAVLAEEPTMLDAYRRGLDLHAITAAEIMGLPFEQFMLLDPDVIEESRRAAKAVNFGLIYGMGAEGLQDYSAKSYGVELSMDQSETYIERFFNLYNRLPVWHETYKKSAYDLGYIRNPLGRIRHLPLIRSQNSEVRSKQERQAVNSPVQSCLSDAMLLAMVELDRRYPDLWMFGMTHDSLEVYIPLDDMEGWARKIKDVMENLPFEKFGWHPPIKFLVDVEVGTESLATVKKLKLG